MKKAIITESGKVHFMEGTNEFDVTIESSDDPNVKTVDLSSMSEEDWEKFKLESDEDKVEDIQKFSS